MQTHLYKSAMLLLQFTAAMFLHAQEKVPDAFKNMSMRSVGPAVMSGRVTSIDVSDQNENLIYIGTASGGLWKSESGGINWEPVFDDQEIIGIGAVCIDPNATDIVWAGTGEGNPRNSQTSGAGIYKSLDAGRTWKKTGLENSYTIHRIVVESGNSNVVYAGVHGSAWGPNSERGVFKTTDGGASWNRILFVNDTVGCADLIMDPTNPNKLLAAMYQYERKPYHFKSGGNGSGLYITVDAGKTWQQLNDKNGLPEGELGRIGVAISPSNPRVVYALIESKKTALYKSNDGGFNWQKINDESVGDRPFYYHELYVDPKNENHLIYLHSLVSESLDGGKTWTVLLPYSGIHPDHHAFWWSKNNSDVMFEGNDGGINFTRDGGETWVFINNLPLGQFYHINYDMEQPYNIYGGMQDNGSWKGPGYVLHRGGITSADWQEILFGDGFDVVPVPDNSRYAYAMSQGGEVYYIDTQTGNNRYIKPVHPDGTKLRFHWNSAIAQDPHDSSSIYFGSQFLHYSTDHGLSWKIISPDLTTNDTNKLKQNKSGGLTPDQTSAENHCTIISIAPSTLNAKTIWVGTDDGNVQLTTDGGVSWKNLTPQITGMPKGSWVPQIVAGVHREGEAFVVVNNYRQNDWKPYLFHTTDFGKTWKNLVNTTQVHGHCLSVVQDFQEPNLIFLGTEHGLFVSFDAGNKWLKWTHNYPNVATQDLKIHPRENDLIIGTFGRAAYILDDITPLRKYTASNGKCFDQKLVAMPSQPATIWSRLQPKGERFPGDLHYAGENKRLQACLGYYFNIEEKKKEVDTKNKQEKKKSDTGNEVKEESSNEKDETKKKKKESEKVIIHIIDFTGDTIRNLTQEPDTGLNYLYWNFDTRGYDFPSTSKPKKDKDETPGGPLVAPGKYKVVFAFGSHKDSTTIEVAHDPRTTFNKVAYDKTFKNSTRFRKITEQAVAGMNAIQEAKETIELVKKAFVNVPDSIKKDVIARGDSLNKKITEFVDIYFAPEDAVGIVDNSDKLVYILYEARGYIDLESHGENTTNALDYAEEETKKVTDNIRLFIENDWKVWQSEVEKIQFRLFKEIKTP